MPILTRSVYLTHSSIVTDRQKSKHLENDLKRLEANYAWRQQDERPMPYSVAKAYRKVIDQRQTQNKQPG